MPDQSDVHPVPHGNIALEENSDVLLWPLNPFFGTYMGRYRPKKEVKSIILCDAEHCGMVLSSVLRTLRVKLFLGERDIFIPWKKYSYETIDFAGRRIEEVDHLDSISCTYQKNSSAITILNGTNAQKILGIDKTFCLIEERKQRLRCLIPQKILAPDYSHRIKDVTTDSTNLENVVAYGWFNPQEYREFPTPNFLDQRCIGATYLWNGDWHKKLKEVKGNTDDVLKAIEEYTEFAVAKPLKKLSDMNRKRSRNTVAVDDIHNLYDIIKQFLPDLLPHDPNDATPMVNTIVRQYERQGFHVFGATDRDNLLKYIIASDYSLNWKDSGSLRRIDF